ncbi:unnamed protein product [Periconia digitata]|uniref:Uncharacterized protein n=1 Tax=Periconia digitata TaxID=1303443 RepID=A0A9W4XVB7_9PLEO|nr:unnamed protein product [Periconia digitata]
MFEGGKILFFGAYTLNNSSLEDDDLSRLAIVLLLSIFQSGHLFSPGSWGHRFQSAFRSPEIDWALSFFIRRPEVLQQTSLDRLSTFFADVIKYHSTFRLGFIPQNGMELKHLW